MPVWAIIVANTCGDMGLYIFETSMPSYLSEVLKLDTKTVSEIGDYEIALRSVFLVCCSE
jgi:hypothetical protein